MTFQSSLKDFLSKVKKPKFQPEREMDEQTDDEQHQNHLVKVDQKEISTFTGFK